MEIITLKDKTSEVVIAPSLGGSVLAYNVDIAGSKRAIFPENISPKNVLDSCCFPLVPFSNRIRDGEFNWLGAKVKLPLNHLPEKHTIHGHGWQVAWKVVEQSETSLTLTYAHQPDAWAYPYNATQKISLQNGELYISLSVENAGDADMPAGLGLHPYFSRTQNTRLSTSISQMWGIDEESMPTQVIDAPRSIRSNGGMNIKGSQLDNALINFPHQANIVWPEWRVGAEIVTSDNCPFLVVYSPEDEEYFCVEPVTHCTDAVNLQAQGHSNTGFKALIPTEEMSMWMKIKPYQLS